MLLTREADRTHFALNPKYLNQIKQCEVIYIRGALLFTVSKQASNLTLMAAHICTQALKIINMNLKFYVCAGEIRKSYKQKLNQESPNQCIQV